ncbi:MAG: 16S rRNA (guanine(527)-N(7))-methyltransferase RsmG [Gammaproteobacteria bacterium]
MNFKNQLAHGLDALQLPLSEVTQTALITYVELLNKWNKAYNLTAIRNPIDMIPLHLLDSLAIGPYLQGDRLIDIGTGPGLPGIPLALAYPAKHFFLLDSNGKKTRFLTQAQLTLGLKNITIVQDRAENFTITPLFDCVISRAFASLTDMLKMTYHLCSSTGRFLAMKGQYPESEINHLPPGFSLEHVYTLTVPLVEAQRHLVILKSNEQL